MAVWSSVQFNEAEWRKFRGRPKPVHLVTPDWYQTACGIELDWQSERLLRSDRTDIISCKKCRAYQEADYKNRS